MKSIKNKIELEYDGDLRFPPYLLHYGPIFLGLFGLLLSISNYSVFIGFDESAPGTWMSLTLMFVSLLIVLPKTRTSNPNPVKRKIAIIISFLLGIAIIDEKLQFHESLGYFVQDNFKNLPISITTYTDDVLIIIGALIGGLLLFYIFKYLGKNSVSRKYFIAVFVAAMVHGLLDLIAHKHYVLHLLMPSLIGEKVAPYQEYLGYFEEVFKLWTEWFFILFVLNLFYNQKGFLTWSIIICIASIFAGFGLWNVELVTEGIPYIVVEGKLKFIRNYHLFFLVTLLWVSWSAVVWKKHKSDNQKRVIASLYLLSPFYLLLHSIEEWRFKIFSFFGVSLDEIIILPLVIIVSILAYYIYKKFPKSLPIMIIASGLIGFSLNKILNQPLFILQIGGILLPVTMFFIIKLQPKKGLLIAATIFSALLIQNPIWFIIIYGYMFLIIIDNFSFEKASNFNKQILFATVLQMILIITLFSASISNLLPVKRFPIKNKILFDVGYQKGIIEKSNLKN